MNSAWLRAMVRLVSELSLPLLTRIWFSLVCLLRVLFDGAFAARAWAARSAAPALPAHPPDPHAAGEGSVPREISSVRGAEADRVAPLQLLGLLQREGRLVDFLQQDITAFDDAEIGAAARVVHEGCGRVLAAHAKIEPVRPEPEESRVEVPVGFDPAEVKLTGSVSGKPPYRGVLRHRGWRVRELSLPEALKGHDFRVIAPAEVEL
jgi:hypothetical protein